MYYELFNGSNSWAYVLLSVIKTWASGAYLCITYQVPEIDLLGKLTANSLTPCEWCLVQMA